MKLADRGFTEAEIAAARFRKQQKEQESLQNQSRLKKRPISPPNIDRKYCMPIKAMEENRRSDRRRERSSERMPREDHIRERVKVESYIADDVDEFGRIKNKATPPRPRSRSRSCYSRRKEEEEDKGWRHDKYDRSSPSPGRSKVVDPNYRPPSPSWISKAGGVAIIKKRKSDHLDRGVK
mmetsp:Transcript_201/g.323  ORF Transcript_201/g.323 Transcript_201/m.323 type:complete len:180 (+) Transcript_201:35-574(+)